MRLATACTLLTGCWPADHGLRIATTTPRKGITCATLQNGEAEAKLALSAVRQAWTEAGYGYARDPEYDTAGPTVCYVPDSALGKAGLHAGIWIYVSMTDRNGRSLALRDTALAHELLHDLIMRSCFYGKKELPICGEDPDHVDARFWGSGSIEDRAYLIWRAMATP